MRKRRTYKQIIVLLCVVILLPLFSVLPAKAKKVIRVAYPIQQGLTMKDEENNYYGYDYDYLMQIAQYTGWTYEFVEVEGTLNERLSTLLTMLEKGEIDLFGGMRQNDALREKFDYPSESYGNAYNVIAVDEDSEIFDFNTLLSHKDLRIAVIESATARIEKLDQFASMNGFTYEKVLCSSEMEMKETIDQGLSDAMLVVDLSKPATYHSIARFSPDPFYFATTKGNSEIITELNQALENVRTMNPTLPSNLYTRYFSPTSQKFRLTVDEQTYVDSHPLIKVLVRDGLAPIQYIDNGEVKGISRDILDAIGTDTGLKFEFITASTYDEYVSYLKNGNINLVLGIPYEMSIADKLNLSLSEPFISNSVVIVTRRDVDPAKLNTLSQGVTNYSDLHYDNNSNLMHYDSPAEILSNIEKKKTDYTYLNQYLFTYYTNKYQYNDLVSFQTPDYFYSQYSYGVQNKEENLMLLSILNKGIRSSKEDMETYIYKNGYVEKDFSITTLIRDNLLFVTSFILALSILIIACIWFYYQHQLKMKKEIELEYQRYIELAEISGEMTFSYDYRHDELKISKYGLEHLSKEAIISPFLKTEELLSSPLMAIKEMLSNKEDVNQELELMLLDQICRWYRVTIKIIKDINKNSSFAVYAVGKVFDIQKEVSERERLVIKSQTDTLTGLLNRAGAEESICNALSKEQGIGALIMMDLDNFKDVNDTYGHFEGDHVLVDTANLLKEIYRNMPIARLGGDEFVIYSSSTNKEEITTLCNTLLTRITNIPSMQNKTVKLTISIGVAFTTLSNDYIELIKYADTSLYDVKRNNRNGLSFYES